MRHVARTFLVIVLVSMMSFSPAAAWHFRHGGGHRGGGWGGYGGSYGGGYYGGNYYGGGSYGGGYYASNYGSSGCSSCGYGGGYYRSSYSGCASGNCGGGYCDGGSCGSGSCGACGGGSCDSGYCDGGSCGGGCSGGDCGGSCDGGSCGGGCGCTNVEGIIEATPHVYDSAPMPPVETVITEPSYPTYDSATTIPPSTVNRVEPTPVPSVPSEPAPLPSRAAEPLPTQPAPENDIFRAPPADTTPPADGAFDGMEAEGTESTPVTPPAPSESDDLFNSEPITPPAEESDDLFGTGAAPAEEPAAPATDTPADETAPADEGSLDDIFSTPADESNGASTSPVLREAGGLASDETRMWIDNTGRYSCQARLVGILDGHARLLKDNGRTTTVSLDRLSTADLAFLNRQARAQERTPVIARTIAGDLTNSLSAN